jgi:hypothetical protein
LQKYFEVIQFEQRKVYLECNDLKQFIKNSKVCGSVKIKAPKNVVHTIWSLLQLNKNKPRGCEILMNKLMMCSGWMKWFMLKFGKKLKILRKEVDGKFERRWKFKKEVFMIRWKFKNLQNLKFEFMGNLLCQGKIDLTSSEGINGKISTAGEEQ